jgi:heat shock protein HtpX
MKTLRLMLTNIPVPNAFAYGSPLAGNRVALTAGLMRELDEEEVEAVIFCRFECRIAMARWYGKSVC